MAISFSESAKAQKNAASTQECSAQKLSSYATPNSNSPIAVNAVEDNWIRSGSYLWYDEYSDDRFSSVDAEKNISVDPSQINLSQEANSQFIPFEIPRYYDGIDLRDKLIQIHYVNADGNEDYDNVVNMRYSSDKIRFAWLVDTGVTYLPGEVQFEIRATGTNEKGDNYCWISRPNGKLNIIASLSGKGIIEPDSDWYSGFVNVMNSKISEATEKMTQAQNAAEQAQLSANDASSAATRAEQAASNAAESVKNEVLDSVAETLSDYYTKEEVDETIKKIDISDQLKDVYSKIDAIDGLANFKTTYDTETRELTFYNGDALIEKFTLNTDPSLEWTTTYNRAVDDKIEKAISPVSEELSQYKTSNDAALKNLSDSVGNLPDTLETDYYKKATIDDFLKQKAAATDVTALSGEVNAVKESAAANKTSITAVGNKVAELEDKIGDINTDPGMSYDATYSEDNVYTLWEVKNEGEEDEVRVAKSSFKISGGGGGTTSSVLKIEYVTKSPLIITTNDTAVIKYNFSGTDSAGDEITEGTAVWKIGNNIIATGIAVSGENSFDCTNFISLGTQKLVLTVTDDAGSLVTKSWSVQMVDIHIESSFNDQLYYPLGEVSFDYTPYGAISKDVHFKLDGTELFKVTTGASGLPMSYNIQPQEHGAHLVEVYITAEINGTTVESNHIFKDVIWYDSTSSIPVIGCVSRNLTVHQYDTENIVYTVYDPQTETPEVTLAVDGNAVSTLRLESNTQIWQYKPTDVGSHVLTITCRDTVKTINVTVEKLDIDVEPITAGLQFDFNPVGKSNSDANRLWSDITNPNIKMTVSDNFDWVSGGYQMDENGDQYFGVKAGTTATISYNLFGDEARKNGKEFKFIFMTENVARSDATFLTCQSGDTTPIGLQMNVHEAYIRSSAKSLYVPYSEEDIIEWDFNINKDSDIPTVLAYEDGTPGRPMSYTSDHSFTQDAPVPITIGSPDCDVRIYRMKAYNTSLSTKAVLSNFIADARTATEMVDRYKRCQIYDENQMLTPESVAAACPDLRIIKIEAPHFTNDKKDFVLNTSMECIYKNGDPTLDNWKFENACHAGQGTTSNEYGQAGRNIDVICCFDGIHQVNSKVSLDPDYKTRLTLGDGTVVNDGAGKISLTRNSVPNNWWNFKVNIASSDMVNNAYGQKRYNTYLPYSTPASRRDSKIKNAMEFVNCVIFIKESDPDISTHREFQDCEYHFYALANMGDSKKTDLSRAYDPDDMNEFCIEISDNTLPNAAFQTGVSNSDGSVKYPITKAEWKEGNTAYDSLYNDWDGSFEFRYDCCGDSKDGSSISSDEEKTKIRTQNRQIWRDFYEFVITSSDDEFVNNLKDWFIPESAEYFYLFTSRYIMIDNRAKNTFWHWAKHYITSAEAATMGDKANWYTIDDDASAIHNGYRFDFWAYDMDTQLGINNSGELTMTYGQEDIDYRTPGVPSSGYVFNAAQSTFFCRLRDLMRSELQKMYATCESKNCWSASSLINQFDAMQNEWCEELWRLDFIRKYERTYRDSNKRFLEEMANGKKKYQRRQFERDQEMYVATEFLGATATSDQIMFRCNTPQTAAVKPDYTLHLTPYADMYIDVLFGNSSPVQVRAKAGQSYDIPCPYSVMDDTAVLIYGASRIQSMGDVSACYIHDNDFSKAEKLKELIIGNTSDGYTNEFLTTLTLGNNRLLRKLDVRNTPNLSSSLDMSACGNLEELYATGSGLTGVLFANGGKIKTALLPATLTSINMKNLLYLDNLQIAGYDQISTMVIESCSTIDVIDLLGKALKTNRVRITGINWSLENTDLLDRLLKMGGIDRTGYNSDQSVLAGSVHVPVIKEKLLADYEKAWSDLKITYNTIVSQYTVTFKNPDGKILDVQYVDKGEKPVDPITRAENPIPTPTMESTVSTSYIFLKWDSSFTAVFSNLVITAVYSATLRTYTVKYLNKGQILETVTGEYGSYIFYDKDTPTYTAEESAYRYNLFERWDKSGLIDGDKEINAVYDTCEYNEGYFDGKSLDDLRPVEIYAMIQLGLEGSKLTVKDPLSIELGYDYSYDDVESKVLIASKTNFDGETYVDTDIKLFDEDKDFVLAIDFCVDSVASSNGVLAQCYQSDGINGFRLWNNSGVKLSWGTASTTPAALGDREIVVIRHVKGEDGLHVYSSNLSGSALSYVALDRTKNTKADNATLVFGCSKADDGAYENYCTGTVFWSKLWYADLGDSACRNLAAWTHETLKLELAGFKKYYLNDNNQKRCSMSFIASELMGRKLSLGNSSTSTGGWASTRLNSYLNERLYNAFPTQWRQLLKKAKVYSSIGDMSKELSSSGCYFFIPSAIEVNPSMTDEPYVYEGSAIDFMTTNQSRICRMPDGTAAEYWLRSPNASYQSYFFKVDETGQVWGYYYAYDTAGVRLMFCF